MNCWLVQWARHAALGMALAIIVCALVGVPSYTDTWSLLIAAGSLWGNLNRGGF